MTTDSTNINALGIKPPQLRQLPSVTNSKQQENADNLVRIDFSRRQTIAEMDKVKSSEALTRNNQSAEKINDSIDELNSSEQLISRNLEFRVDSNSGRTVITVRDSESKEIIRQIPSEQLLEISSKLKELQESKLEETPAAGILFTSQT